MTDYGIFLIWIALIGIMIQLMCLNFHLADIKNDLKNRK